MEHSQASVESLLPIFGGFANQKMETYYNKILFAMLYVMSG